MKTKREFKLTEFDPPTRIRWTEVSKNLVTASEGGYDLSADGEGTRLTVHNQLEGHGIGKLLVGLAVRAAQKDADAFAGRIEARRRILLTPVPPDPPDSRSRPPGPGGQTPNALHLGAGGGYSSPLCRPRSCSPARAARPPTCATWSATSAPSLLERAVEAVGEDPFERVGEGTRFAQPALYCASVALWMRAGSPEPGVLAGHSLGEVRRPGGRGSHHDRGRTVAGSSPRPRHGGRRPRASRPAGCWRCSATRARRAGSPPRMT